LCRRGIAPAGAWRCRRPGGAIGWQQRFGRTVGWSFAAGHELSSERAFFCVSALDAIPSDLGVRSELSIGHQEREPPNEIVSLAS